MLVVKRLDRIFSLKQIFHILCCICCF